MAIRTKNFYKRLAFALSLVMILIWIVMGTGTSLAWFSDSDTPVRNIIHFAEFELEVSHRLEDGTYEVIESDTKVFDDEALYEPGYTQIVYIKAQNKGTIPFDLQTAVYVNNYTVPTNVFGQQFLLQDYLKFGIVTGATEEEVEAQVLDRETAKSFATMRLNNYSTEKSELQPSEVTYMALIIYMPESVGNEANYRRDVVPEVDLGIIFSATQKTD